MYDASTELNSGGRVEYRYNSKYCYNELIFYEDDGTTKLATFNEKLSSVSDINTDRTFNQSWICDGCSDVIKLNKAVKEFMTALGPKRIVLILKGVQTWTSI